MRMGGWRTRSVFDRYNIRDDKDMKEATKLLNANSANPGGRTLDEIGREVPETRRPRTATGWRGLRFSWLRGHAVDDCEPLPPRGVHAPSRPASRAER